VSWRSSRGHKGLWEGRRTLRGLLLAMGGLYRSARGGMQKVTKKRKISREESWEVEETS
jgi:hypothetical protein